MHPIRKIMKSSPYVEVAIRQLYWGSPILPAIAQRYRKARGARRARWSRGRSTSVAKVIRQLREWGVGQGDLLAVHSSYRQLRRAGDTPSQVVDALLELVGPTGTLALPAVPYWPDAPQSYERLVADVSELILEFNPRTTPTWTGAIPTAMLQRGDAVRSLHPLNNIVAIGPLARPMMKGNLDGERPLASGAKSCWRFCYQNNVKVVALGVDMAHSLTMIHLAEDMLGDDWPVEDWYRDRKFRVTSNGESRVVTVRERHPKWARHYAERTLSRDLHRKQLCKQASMDGVNMEYLDGRPMVDYLNTRNASCYPYYAIPAAARKVADPSSA